MVILAQEDLLFRETQADQRIQGESGISHPSEPVIPVPRSTNVLWQREGGSSNNRTGFLKNQHLTTRKLDACLEVIFGMLLQCQRGTVHRLPPSSLVLALADPLLPVIGGLLR